MNTLVDTWDAVQKVEKKDTKGPPAGNTVKASRESKEDGNGRSNQGPVDRDVQRSERSGREVSDTSRNREVGRENSVQKTFSQLSKKSRDKVRIAVLSALNADAETASTILRDFGADYLSGILYDRIVVNGETMRGYELLFPDLRKNLSMAALEAQGIENDYVIDETTGKAAWTPEHIEWLYKAHSNPGSDTETNYAKAYAVYMSPADFLSLTATDSARARIELESVRKYGELDADKLKSDMGSPYLNIDFETGTVTGHEGRHRMVLMQNAGIEQVPVVITPYEQGDKYNRTVVGRLRVSGQEWSNGKAPGKVTLRRIVPLSSNYRSEVEARFGGDAEIKFSRDAKDSRESKEVTDNGRGAKAESRREFHERVREGLLRSNEIRGIAYAYEPAGRFECSQTAEQVKRELKSIDSNTKARGAVERETAFIGRRGRKCRFSGMNPRRMWKKISAKLNFAEKGAFFPNIHKLFTPNT